MAAVRTAGSDHCIDMLTVPPGAPAVTPQPSFHLFPEILPSRRFLSAAISPAGCDEPRPTKIPRIALTVLVNPIAMGPSSPTSPTRRAWPLNQWKELKPFAPPARVLPLESARCSSRHPWLACPRNRRGAQASAPVRRRGTLTDAFFSLLEPGTRILRTPASPHAADCGTCRSSCLRAVALFRVGSRNARMGQPAGPWCSTTPSEHEAWNLSDVPRRCSSSTCWKSVPHGHPRPGSADLIRLPLEGCRHLLRRNPRRTPCDARSGHCPRAALIRVACCRSRRACRSRGQARPRPPGRRQPCLPAQASIPTPPASPCYDRLAGTQHAACGCTGVGTLVQSGRPAVRGPSASGRGGRCATRRRLRRRNFGLLLYASEHPQAATGLPPPPPHCRPPARRAFASWEAVPAAT